MKITSVQTPQQPFEIRKIDKNYFAIFYNNVTESSDINGMTGQSITMWDYDKYSLEIPYSVNLAARIESDYANWLQKAKDAEKLVEETKIRDYRDQLLNDIDVKYCNAEKWTNMTDDKKSEWTAYKQALRDVPEQSGFPYTITFPKIPKF